jgi:hypothetical protein
VLTALIDVDMTTRLVDDPWPETDLDATYRLVEIGSCTLDRTA